jgi:formamidopyrimidine-DNA glycosylase
LIALKNPAYAGFFYAAKETIMPELPEVETTRRGVEPFCKGQILEQLIVRQPKLRWPVPVDQLRRLEGQMLDSVERRGKYLLFNFDDGAMVAHLGMSGSMRVLTGGIPEPAKHDHIDWVFANGVVIRFTDPRRFGSLLWQPKGETIKLIETLGPEPLSDQFDADYLFAQCKGRSIAIKQRIMDSHVVVGVGNIYANESLFAAGIDPRKPAGKVSKARLALLVFHVKEVLAKSIEQGGTTLKDFVNSDGKPGYFAQSLSVYGRGGEPCHVCQSVLKEIRMGQRTTVFCPKCQK